MRPRLNNSNGICVPHGPEHLLGTGDGLTMRQLLPGSPHGFLAVLCGPGTGQGAQRGGRAQRGVSDLAPSGGKLQASLNTPSFSIQ